MANAALQQPRFFAPGDKLGKYALVRQIAVGGMAELYLARTLGLEGFDKLVCVKRILPQYVGSASFVAMFLKEARLVATLHHPNIAQVFDIGEEQGDYFFAMEYVHGEDLGRLLAAAQDHGVPIGIDAALTFVVGLCAGLHYAHEKCGTDGAPLDVVHRDVSPSNVLVSYDGAVKLVDFGIARAGNNPTTAKGGLKGKIAYMSPEQCQGGTRLDRRSDLFSVGSILYELTTGRPPFQDETEYGVLNQIVTRDAEPPSKWVPNYPPALEAIVMRALARDPQQRYRTARDLQSDLERFAQEHALRISPLVLNRLMSTLFPARQEEWDRATAQGAFFVEQHVVRTLIESGKTSDSAPVYVPAPSEPSSNDESPTQLLRPSAPVLPPSRPTPRPMAVPAAPPEYVAVSTEIVKPLDYMSDHTELVRPLDAPRSRTPAAARRAHDSRMKLAAAIGGGLVLLAIVIGVATSGGRAPLPAMHPVEGIQTPASPPAPPPPSATARVIAPPAPDPVPPPAPDPVPPPAPESTAPKEAPLAVDDPALVIDDPDPASMEAPLAPKPSKRPASHGKKPKAKPPRPKPLKPKPLKPKPPKTTNEEKPWNADSPFMPVRPAGH